jgi:hypothetical protein
MAGNTLTVNSTLQCPHGGAVQIITTNTRAKAAGGFIATSADTFVITGCPFQIPATPPIPSPCVTVQWLVPDVRVKVNGSFTLSQASVGLCLSAAQLPQGPVIIANTQTKASSM